MYVENVYLKYKEELKNFLNDDLYIRYYCENNVWIPIKTISCLIDVFSNDEKNENELDNEIKLSKALKEFYNNVQQKKDYGILFYTLC